MTDVSLRLRRAAAARARASPWRAGGLWSLAVGMAVVATAIGAAALPAAAVPAAPLHMPWWAVAAAFALAEAAVIHIPVQRDTHTISMSEIPLVLGLAFASPAGLLVGRLTGSALVLALRRRQPPPKLAFNLSMFALETVMALIIFRALLGGESPNSPYGWVATLAAVMSAIVISVCAINVAIAVNTGRSQINLKPFASGILISLGMGFVGTLCLLTVWHDVRALVVLGGAAAMFFVLIRVYGSLSRRHDDLQAVYSFKSATSVAATLRELIRATLHQISGLLHAERVALAILPPGASVGDVTALDDDGSVVEAAMRIDRLLDQGSGGQRIYGPDTRPADLDPLFGASGRRSGLIAPMIMSDGTAGVLVVEGRVGPVREFTTADSALLDALAGHSALTIERALMVDRLTAEVKAKQEVIQSKNRLIASVSHELRTPLTGILGFAEALRDDILEWSIEDRRAYTGMIAANALDMSHLVEDLLAAARAAEGLPVHLEAVSLRELAVSVLERGGAGAGRAVVEGEAGDALGDQIRVRQILRNLISNAEKYGGTTIRIVVESEAEVSHVSVLDDGAGIPSAMREHVFAPYRSAHHSDTQPGSLGLGLSTSRTLARLMDGELTYDYRDGWSVFRLTLPREDRGSWH